MSLFINNKILAVIYLGWLGRTLLKCITFSKEKLVKKQSYRNVFFRGMMEQQPYYDKLHAKNISIRFVSLSFEK